MAAIQGHQATRNCAKSASAGTAAAAQERDHRVREAARGRHPPGDRGGRVPLRSGHVSLAAASDWRRGALRRPHHRPAHRELARTRSTQARRRVQGGRRRRRQRGAQRSPTREHQRVGVLQWQQQPGQCLRGNHQLVSSPTTQSSSSSASSSDKQQQQQQQQQLELLRVDQRSAQRDRDGQRHQDGHLGVDGRSTSPPPLPGDASHVDQAAAATAQTLGLVHVELPRELRRHTCRVRDDNDIGARELGRQDHCRGACGRRHCQLRRVVFVPCRRYHHGSD